MDIPVFVHPTELYFNVHHRDTHKQMITLYNTYGFPIRYRVSCTNPRLFDEVEDGLVRDSHSHPIPVRLAHLPPYSSTPVKTKFRVQIYDARRNSRQEPPTQGQGILSGQRILTAWISFDPAAVVPPTLGAAASSERETLAATSSSMSGSVAGDRDDDEDRDRDRDRLAYRDRDRDRDRGGGGLNINIVAVVVAITCMILLLFPNELEPTEKVPPYLHLSINTKLIAAFALGLMTSVILRQ